MKEKTVFITGGGYGLGRVLCEEFFKEGYIVYFTYRTKRKEVEELLKKGQGKIFSFQADGSDVQEVKSSVENAVEKLGHIDILVNNAASARDSSLEKSNPDDFDFTIRNVLYPTYYYSKEISTHMISQGAGKIINIGSVNGLHGREGSIAYSAAKAGVVGLTKTMAKELGKYFINCNVVVPGYIATDGQKNTSELIKKLVLNECYIRRLSEPEEVANLVLFLASEKANNITGQVYQIDCGQYI